MESIIIHPKDHSEFELLKKILVKMNVSSQVISDEEQEDLGLAMMMKEVDRSKKVSKNAIMGILNLK